MVLQLLRSKKFAKRVLFALLILIIPAFVLWGVGSLGTGPAYIGKIGSQKIYDDDFAESRRGIKIQILFAYFGDSATLNQILRNRPLVNQMAWERLVLLNEARSGGFKAQNKDVVNFLSQHPLFVRNGVFDKEVYDNILRNFLGLASREFEELVRENLQIKAFRDELLKDITVSDEDILEFYKKTNDQVGLSFILVENSSFAEQVSVSDNEAEKYYTDHKDEFVEPAKCEVEYIEFPYETASEKTTAISGMEKIYPQLQKYPTKMAEIAEEQGKKHGRTEQFSREDVITGIPFFKDFHNIAFAMEEGEISPPIFSSPEKGTAYILRKVKDIPPQTKAFDEVIEEVIVLLEEKQHALLAEEKANELYEKISEEDLSLEYVALDTDHEITRTEPIAFNWYIENVGPAEEIVFQALKTEQGEVMPPVTVPKGVFLARVDTILPADRTEFENKKDLLRRNLMVSRQMKAMEKWLKEKGQEVELKTPLQQL